MIKSHNRDGSTMLMVMVVLIALTILTVGMFKLAEHNAVESYMYVNDAQALWVAESGLQQNLYKVLNDSTYRNSLGSGKVNATIETSTVAVNDSGLTGSYETYTWKSGVNDYMIEVTGVVGDMKRRLSLSAENVGTSLPYPLMTTGGKCDIKAGTAISGGIYTWDMDIKLGAGVAISETIYTAAFNGDPTGYDVEYLTEHTDPVTVDFTINDGELSDAVNGTPAFGSTHNGDLITATVDLNTYADNALYVNGHAQISQEIIGPGKLVVSGDVKMLVNYTIDSNVQIINGIDFKGWAPGTLGTNLHIFSKNHVILEENTFMPANAGSSIICGGDFEGKAGLVYSGLIVSGNNMKIAAGAQIEGSILSLNDTVIEENSVITHAPVPIPGYMSYTSTNATSSGSDNTWNEIPAL